MNPEKKQASTEDTAKAEAHLNRGKDYFEANDYDAAIVELDQAIAINAELSEAWFYRGKAYVMKDDFDRAIADYTQAIRPDLNDVRVYFNRGIAYAEKEDYYIHFHMKGELKKLALSELRLKGKKRGKITEMTLIDERPAEVEGREISEPLGRGFDNRFGAQERTVHNCQEEKPLRSNRFAGKIRRPGVRKKIEKRFKKLDGELAKSITFDHGKENTGRKTLEKTPV